MNNACDINATPKHSRKTAKKVANAPAYAGDAEAKYMKELWLAISVDLVFHPKLVCAAMELDIDEAHMLGVLVRMWLMTFKYAKDGDLWRGSDEATYRFLGVITGYKGDVRQLVDALRGNRWLDGWLIHDWLDYVGPFLVKSFNTSKRAWLVATWAKYGKLYGARGEEPPDDGGESAEADGNNSGSDQEAVRNRRGSKQELQPKPLHNPIPTQTNNREIEPKTLSPPALGNNKRKALNGGLGGIVSAGDVLGGMNLAAESLKTKGFLHFVKEGGQAEGLNTSEFPLALVMTEDVYAAYRNLLRFHGILTTRVLREKITYCQASPAAWAIMLQDKVHAAYRDRDDGPLIETDGADPVAMTIAALRPQKYDKRHTGTGASTNLFTEVMIDFAQMCCGQNSVWQSRLSGPAIAFELDKRKGKRGRAQNN